MQDCKNYIMTEDQRYIDSKLRLIPRESIDICPIFNKIINAGECQVKKNDSLNVTKF